jgi:hypothetical protein
MPTAWQLPRTRALGSQFKAVISRVNTRTNQKSSARFRNFKAQCPHDCRVGETGPGGEGDQAAVRRWIARRDENEDARVA